MCLQASRGKTSSQIYCSIYCAVLYMPKFPSLGTTLIPRGKYPPCNITMKRMKIQKTYFQSASLPDARYGRCCCSAPPVLISLSVRRLYSEFSLIQIWVSYILSWSPLELFLRLRAPVIDLPVPPAHTCTTSQSASLTGSCKPTSLRFCCWTNCRFFSGNF